MGRNWMRLDFALDDIHVKTDLNWSMRVLGLDLLSLNKLLFRFSSVKPMLSRFLDFTYFQNGLLLFCASASLMMLFRKSHSALLRACLHYFCTNQQFVKTYVRLACLCSLFFFRRSLHSLLLNHRKYELTEFPNQ